MSMLQSTNPVLAEGRLDAAMRDAAASQTPATVSGVVNKTSLCVGVAVVFGAMGYSVVKANPALLGMVNMVAFVAALAVGFALWGRPAWAAVLAPIYAATQGFFLGAIAMVLDRILAAQGVQLAGGIALQAFVITIGVSVACLVLYRSGAIRFSQRGAAILWAAVLGIAFVYLLSFVLGLFGISMPLLSLPTQAGSSQGAWIGLAINGVILVVAALTLVLDMQRVDEAVQSGAPASSEWYLAYGLLVSLVWIYLESMKIIFRLAMIFGGGKRN